MRSPFFCKPAQGLPGHAQVGRQRFFGQALHEFGIFLEQEFVALLGIGREVGEEPFLLLGEAVVRLFPEEVFHLVKGGAELFAVLEGEAEQFGVLYGGDIEDGLRVMIERVLIGDPATFVGKLDDVFFAVWCGEGGGEKSIEGPVGMMDVVAGADQELVFLQFLRREVGQDFLEFRVAELDESFQVLSKGGVGFGGGFHGIKAIRIGLGFGSG